jgi:DNA-binding GntR family transcriptional regulator
MENGMLNSVPAENPLYVDQVYLRLLDSISLGDLKPGERVRQAELADRLGVSRQPISHALHLLKHQGLVRDAGKQGVEVSPVEPGHVLHLYEARTPLEAAAASRAAARVRDGLAPSADIEAMHSALARGSQAAREGASLATLVRADSEFHGALYKLSGNPVIEQMMRGQWPHLMRSMLVVLEDRGVPTRAWEEHARIAAFVLAGDAVAASDVLLRHLERAGADLHRRLNAAADSSVP